MWQSAFMGLGQAAGQTAAPSFTAPVTRNLDYIANAFQPNRQPDEAALWRLLGQGRTNPDLLRTLFGMQGICGPRQLNPDRPPGIPENYPGLWQQVYESTWTVPAPGEMLDLLNRRWIDGTVAERWLKQGGMFGPRERFLLQQLRHQMPGPSDLISFALKEGWDAQVVQRFQYDAEFPAEFRHWMQQQGFNQEDPRPAEIRGQSPWVPWYQMYWRVHWANIAPGQAYEMYQRLRANRLPRYQVNGLNPREFTLDDLRTVLKINDYPVPFRDQLAALAYRNPRLVDIDHFYHLRVISQTEVEEVHKDLGYNPTDAANRTRYIVAADAIARRKALLGDPVHHVLELYKIGILDRDHAALRLYEAHWAGTPLVEWQPNQDEAHKINTAKQDANVVAALDQVDLLVRVEAVKAGINDMKMRYKRGITNYFGTITQLRDMGVDPERAVQYVDLWRTMFRGVRVASTARQLLRWFRYGIMDQSTLVFGLTELGYEMGRIHYMLADVGRDRLLDQARAQEKAAKTAAAVQAAQLRQARLIQQQHNQVIGQLVRQASQTKLTRWFVRGIISEAQLRAALAARDYLASTVNALVADAKIDRADYLQKKQAAAAKAAKAAGKGS